LFGVILFDVYVGVSAGNLNIAEMLAGTTDPLRMYYDFVQKNQIITKKHMIPGGKKVINLHPLRKYYQDYLSQQKPELIKKYGEKVYISLTDRALMTGEILKLKDVGENLVDVLLAGATIPGISTEMGHVKDEHYCDGVFYYCDPFMAAYDLGCTHTLVLSTRSSSKVTSEPPKSLKYILKIIDKIDSNLDDLFRTRLKLYREILEGVGDGPFRYQGVQAFSVAVEKGKHGVKNLTLDEWTVVNAAYQGYKAVVDVFDPSSDTIMTPKMVPRRS
jgi:predicted patatin/cPLA2 family phospholipase